MSTITLGMVGVSEGNGHPYSFSSIINGYSKEGLADAGWDVIYDYVREKDPSEIGFDGVEVTHAWTQDRAETERLCAAANIDTQVDERSELVGAVDGVIIARDDYENHLEMARPFLDAGMHVFVDKPLAMDPDELRTFRPYLRDGTLMSCSGLRYATELDAPRSDLTPYGDLKLVRGAVLYDWERYGVHLLDAIFNVLDAEPRAVEVNDAEHTSVAISMRDGPLVEIDALGDVPLTFSVALYGSQKRTHHELEDNFRAFRRTLWHFVESVRTGQPAIPPDETLSVLRTLVAGREAERSGDPVELASLDV
jgi:hypothetical protein